jgi:DNA-binding LacI/PurR family transcriptional regulator
MGAVTRKDLATRLGLSITTISRALAGYGDVAESTRQRVLQAAEEMAYVPDVTARRLRKGRTDTIGFVIPTSDPRLSDPSSGELLAGIGNEATRHGFDLLVATCSPDTPEERAAYRHNAGGRQVDGLLVGRDVVIIGFDDIPLGEHSHPSLTTVRQLVYDIGRQIRDMLVRLIRGETLAECHVLLQSELIVRESSGAGQDGWHGRLPGCERR